MDQVNSTGLETEIVGLQYNGKLVVFLFLLGHLALPANETLWCNHLLIDHPASNSVTIGITVWRNCELRMLHASALLAFPKSQSSFYLALSISASFFATKLLLFHGIELQQVKLVYYQGLHCIKKLPQLH